jgi:hypothetical protein
LISFSKIVIINIVTSSSVADDFDGFDDFYEDGGDDFYEDEGPVRDGFEFLDCIYGEYDEYDSYDGLVEATN